VVRPPRDGSPLPSGLRRNCLGAAQGGDGIS
jgi:hypothetical protein